MTLQKMQVQSGKVFSFSFNGLETDNLYYAYYFEETEMVVIFRTKQHMFLESDSILIDRWMSAEQFSQKVSSGYIELEMSDGEIIYSTGIEDKIFNSVLDRYSNIYPMVKRCS